MKPGAENQVSFSEIRIQDGELKYEDAANHVSEQLGDIDLVAGVAVDLALVRGDRPIRLARRTRRRLDLGRRLRRDAVGRPLRPEGAAWSARR